MVTIVMVAVVIMVIVMMTRLQLGLGRGVVSGLRRQLLVWMNWVVRVIGGIHNRLQLLHLAVRRPGLAVIRSDDHPVPAEPETRALDPTFVAVLLDRCPRLRVQMRQIPPFPVEIATVPFGNIPGLHVLGESWLDVMFAEDKYLGHRNGIEPPFDPAPYRWEEGGSTDDLQVM